MPWRDNTQSFNIIYFSMADMFSFPPQLTRVLHSTDDECTKCFVLVNIFPLTFLI